MLQLYEGNKSPASLELSLSRSSRQSEPGSMVCMAFQTWSQQVLAGMLADGPECVLARLFGPATCIRDAAMVERSDKGKRSCVLLKGVFTCENGSCVGGDVWPACRHRKRGGSWPPGESLHRTYEKALAMPMAGPAMWKKISFLSGVNLDKLPTSQFLCSLGCKEVVTNDLLPKVTARITWVNTCNVLRS